MEEGQCSELATAWAPLGLEPHRGLSTVLCFWQVGHLAVAETRQVFVVGVPRIAYTPATKVAPLMYI